MGRREPLLRAFGVFDYRNSARHEGKSRLLQTLLLSPCPPHFAVVLRRALPVGGFDARRVDQPPCFVGIPGPQLDLHGQCYRTLWHTDTIWGALVARRRRALLLVLADSGTSSFTTRHRNRRNNNLHYVHFAAEPLLCAGRPGRRRLYVAGR